MLCDFWELWLLLFVVLPVALLRAFDLYELYEGRASLTDGGVFVGVPAKWRYYREWFAHWYEERYG